MLGRHRLYWDNDRRTLVREDDPRALTLAIVGDVEVTSDVAEAYEAWMAANPDEEKVVEEEAAPVEGEPPSTKEQAGPAEDKQLTPTRSTGTVTTRRTAPRG